jgi:hypothetical protein
MPPTAFTVVAPKGEVELGWEEKEVEGVLGEPSPPHADTSIALSVVSVNSGIRLTIIQELS